MSIANLKQNLQDWITQQWVILTGSKVDLKTTPWLIGPFGSTGEIGDSFINDLAIKEQLRIKRNETNKGLIASINDLDLALSQRNKLSEKVIDFYEKTANYSLDLNINWNPFFKPFGFIVNSLFSSRLKQLFIPTNNNDLSQSMVSEIITLSEPKTEKIKFTFWFRKTDKSEKVIYSGIYGTCKIPNNQTCIKATFPLPYGNATIILLPKVGSNGELILESIGKKVGDPGFYFLLKDSKNIFHTRFIKSFQDKLVVSPTNNGMKATQTLKLWGFRVLQFNYTILPKSFLGKN